MEGHRNGLRALRRRDIAEMENERTRSEADWLSERERWSRGRSVSSAIAKSITSPCDLRHSLVLQTIIVFAVRRTQRGRERIETVLKSASKGEIW